MSDGAFDFRHVDERESKPRELQDVLDAIGEYVDISEDSHAAVGAILDETHRRTEPKSLSKHPSC